MKSLDLTTRCGVIAGAITGVIINGELFERRPLNERLSALDALYAPYRSSFSPIGEYALERPRANGQRGGATGTR